MTKKVSKQAPKSPYVDTPRRTIAGGIVRGKYVDVIVVLGARGHIDVEIKVLGSSDVDLVCLRNMSNLNFRQYRRIALS